MEITRDEQGNYCWDGKIDRSYEHKAFKIAFGVCGGICAMFILMSLILGGDMLGITLLSTVGVMAVVGGVCWLFNRNAGNRRQGYIMTEDAILFRRRKYNAPFTFRSIKKAVVYPSRDMIELYQAVGSGPVFIPHEEFEFVKDFILRRLPDTAEVVYG